MDSPDPIEAVLPDTFEDVALLIGAAAATHGLEDCLVWTLLRRLDRVRRQPLSRLSRAGGAGAPELLGRPQTAHPAVEEFLIRNQAGCPERESAGHNPLPGRQEEACRS